MTEELQPPLVPPDVDLRDYPRMPLKVVRLRDSDLVTYSTGDEFKAAVLLWCAAWHQVPAGSLPNDDKWLAKHSGSGRSWKKDRAGAMRGWMECSDGRLYHPVLSETVMESWATKLEQRSKTAAARAAAAAKRLSQAQSHGQSQGGKAAVTKAVTDLGRHLSQTEKRSVTSSVTSSKGSKEVLPQALQTPSSTARATAETSTAGIDIPFENQHQAAPKGMSRDEQLAWIERNKAAR